jgi:hypothetical protein
MWTFASGKLRPFVARRVPAADVDDVLQDVYVRVHFVDNARKTQWWRPGMT